MDPFTFLLLYVAAGIALAALAGLTALRLRAQGLRLAAQAADRGQEVPPLVGWYFRWMARLLAFCGSGFLLSASADGIAALASAPGLVPRILGFVSATLLLACASLMVMAGTADLRLRMVARWHRLLLLAGGAAGAIMSAAAMVQLVAHGRLWN